MYIDGLIPANPTNVYNSYTHMDGWSYVNVWSPETAYYVGGTGGGEYDRFTSQTPGTKTRIEVDLRILSTERRGLERLYLIADATLKPNEVIANAIASAAVQDVQTLQTVVFDNISVSGDYFYIVFASDSTKATSYLVQAVRAVTSYTVFPELKNVYGPTGYVSTFDSVYFSADIEPSVGSYNPFTFSDASLRWRAGSVGPFTAAEMSITREDTRATAEVYNSTFPVGAVEWYITATANTGETLETVPASFNSWNPYLDVTPVSPVDSLAGNNAPITFEWSPHSGFQDFVSRFDLQYSEDGALWIDLGSTDVTGYGSRYYTAPANTFSAGTVFWRVRAIGVNGGAGAWSTAASFEAIGAPVVRDVAATAVPFTTVTWTATGELAYKVQISGETYGPIRDTGTQSFQPPVPLEDGEHVLKVAAQNKYGLWSAWGETSVTVQNVPGTAVVIAEAAGSGAGTAGLTITGGEASGDFLIYRDGALIGRTEGRSYTDRTAAPGAHEYYVLQVLPGGYYTKSNTVTLSTEAKCPMLALLSGGEFLALELSAEADRSQTITKGGEVVYVQYSGAKFPEAEVGEAESLTVSGDGSFTAEQEAEARRFEAMLKKPVIYKTPGGEVVVGVLQGFTRRDPKFFKSYVFQVTQMEWRDYSDA